MPRKYEKLVHETPNPERVKACIEYFNNLTENIIKPTMVKLGYLPKHKKEKNHD